MSFIRRLAMAGAGGAAACAVALGSPAAAQPALAHTPTSASVLNAATTTHAGVHPDWCSAQWWITADGVRIHTAPNLGATVVGLAYTGDEVTMLSHNNPAGWSEITDYRTGQPITGWIANQFVIGDEWCD